MSIPAKQSIKGYELLELIGEGAYGAVYRARQEFIDREVALKIILPAYANQPDFIRRFDTEAQLVAQLEHLHIVPLYDYWRDPEGAYLVMRLMKGGSLAALLKETGSWEPSLAARLVEQIASALDLAHQQGVVHRDLKPGNILLDEDNNAYLSDFGIAKEIGGDQGATFTGAILGTPAYIAPEQVQSQPVTPQTDIYALGILLYELLVGEHPFPDSSTGELVAKHLSEALPYVRESRPELPAALDGVIQRATAKNPADRYFTASALAEDFRRALQLEAALPEVPEEEMYNPYKGLRAFQEADCDDFFGREALTGQLLAQLAQPGVNGCFLAVVGPSGSGKSSVVKAGLVPALRKGALPGSENWFIVEMHPGLRPMRELHLALLSISADPNTDLGELLAEDEDGLVRAAEATLPGAGSELLLVIDQFEELFILVEDEAERAQFLANLHRAVTDEKVQVRVVVTLRADFYDRPLLHPEFGRLVEERTAVVLPLASEELELAIHKPAERVGAVLEKGLIPAVVSDVVNQPGGLPLLQYALTELFERREGRMLTCEAYQSIGGVLGALGRRAEQVYASLGNEGKVVARQLFLRLVTLGEGAEDTRRRVSQAELEALTSHSPLPLVGEEPVLSSSKEMGVREVLDSFGKARLLTFDHDPETRQPTIEVAHESLLGEWRRLREWLDHSRADIRMQRVLGNAAQEWQAAGRDAGYLLRGTRLDQFEAWADSTDMALTQVEGDYLDESLVERRARLDAEAERQAREAAMERRSRNFLRALVIVFAVAALVAVGLTIFAFNQQGIAQSEANQRATAEVVALEEREEALNQADAQATQQAIAEEEAGARAIAEEQALEERDRAVEAEQDALEQREEALRQAAIGLASQSELELEGTGHERAVLLAMEALKDYPYTWQAERALGQAILSSRLRLIVPHSGELLVATWSSDGSKILISGNIPISESEGENAFTQVLDAYTGDDLLTITEGEPSFASWSPDDMSILTVNEEDTIVKIWDLESGAARFTLDVETIGSGLWINYNGWETWSPTGDRFLIYNDLGLVKIFDAITGETLQTLSGHGGAEKSITQASWSPGGDLVAVSSLADNSVIVYESGTGEALYTIPGGFEDEVVVFASWSPSGDRFATRGLGGTKVYETATGRRLLDLSAPQTKIWQALWSPDGSRILTRERGDSATVWDAESGQKIINITGMVFVLWVDWSPSGELVAIGGADGFVHVWDVVNGQEFAKLSGTMGHPNRVEFSPDGERILVAGDDNTFNLLDLSEASLSIPVPTCGWFSNVAWSPDGEQVAIGSNCPPDYHVKVWDANSGEQLLEIRGDGGMQYMIAWSPSGDRIAITYEDLQGAMIWDAVSGEKLSTFDGHHGNFMTDLDWSPDGSQLVTTGAGSPVIIWNSKTGEDVLSFSGHQYAVSSVAWSPDGSRIISASEEGEALIWEAASGEVLLDLLPNDFTSAISDVKWTKDGRRVFLLSADGFVRIFDSESGDLLSQFFTPIGSDISTISLSPTEERMIIGGYDGAAKVLNTTTGTEMISYDVGGVVYPAYSPDGARVLIGKIEGDWGKVQVFPTWHSTQELVDYARECCVVRELTPEEREVFGLPPR